MLVAFESVMRPLPVKVSIIRDAVMVAQNSSTMRKVERLDEAVDLMHQSGFPLSQHTLCCLLQECTTKKDLIVARRLHCIVISSGLLTVPILGDYLIRLYGACGSLLEASLVFCNVAKPSVYTWHAVISAHVIYGEFDRAVDLYNKMRLEGTIPNQFVITCILKACSDVGAIEQGKLIHDEVIRKGLASEVVIGSTLVDMYAKFGNLKDACKVFEGLPQRDLVSWSAMLAGYAQHGCSLSALKLFGGMEQQEGIKPDKVMFLLTLKACSCLGSSQLGELLHCQIIRSGFESDVIVGNTLVDMYAKCGSLEEARKVFGRLGDQTVVSWGAMIAGYADHGDGFAAFELLDEMQCKGMKANKVIFLCILKACSTIAAIEQVRLIHHEIIRCGLESDLFLGSTLIDIYAKCGSVEAAYKVFDKLPNRNVVSWGAMIAGYAQHDGGLIALELYERMQQEGLKPAKVTSVCILKACSNIGDLGQGKRIHHHIVESGYESIEDIGNMLIDMYAKCWSVEDARTVFDKLCTRNVLSWSAMIAGYALHGHGLLALEHFASMLQEGIKPDKVMFLCVLKACGSIGAFRHGKLIHKQIVICGFEGDLALENALIDMYTKCWCLEEACKVFNELPTPDIVTWGTLIAGYAQYGNCRLARLCLGAMEQQGMKPNSVIFTSLLSACRQAGNVEEGDLYLRSMREIHGITPRVEHFTCMVDLLASAGHLKEAERLLHSMPSQGATTGWMSLLSACRTYGNVELGQRCFDRLVLLNRSIAAGYILMANIYADAHMWEDFHKTREMSKGASVLKMPGRAWIELKKSVYEFVVGDIFHSVNEKTFTSILVRSLKEDGYVPQLDQS